MDEGADKQEQEGLIATPTAPTAPTHPVPTAEDNPAPPATSPTSPDDDDQYEREDVQKKTFAKWINSQLAKGQHPPVTDLFYDLRDGTRLLALLEVLTNKTYKREKGRMRVHHLNNVSRALSILEEHNVKLINISNEHIVDGSAKLTLGLVWAIILHWQVQGVLKDVMSDLQQTNLEKTLLAWCRQTTKGYHGVDVRNFTTSWTDGLAFNALIHSHRPQLFDWTVMARKHPYARLENAFRLANEHFNIERLLDPEDVNSQVPDKKSIMMYVMCLFQALPHGSFTMESLDVSIQSDSSFSLDTSSENVAQATSKGRPLSNVSIGLGEYQRTLEEVLTWLLGAEDRLAVMPPIANSTEEVKDQFHDLEELMLELTSKQGGIGDVLGEGSRLLKEGVMEEEEEEEVRVQMKLLNTRWEDLRVKAMDRQSRLHEKLMTLQQTQLESLKKWLTETEDRIANMSQVGPTTDLLREQIAAHQSLQEDLESEQANINSLSNMVVVVDESSSDSAYSSLEDELNALGERWAHICRWAESRWKTLQTLSVHWTHYEQEMNKMGEWMNEKESLLREVESNPSSDQEHILRQASMLQILQAEMEVQHRRFEHLQEESAKVLSHLPQDSPGQEKIPSELEMVQDRLDCLVSIIEAQTQRMAANGIDIKKVVIPADNTSDIVSSSTTTISHEDATVVTKIITTKIVTTETVEGSVIKRQKLEGGSQEDFSVALHQLGGWMDSLEAEVRPKVAGELTVEQLMQLAQQLENEIESQKEEYYKVVSLGQSAISETSTIGESAKESEQQVAGITSRWEALNAMLIEIRTRITFLTQKKKVTTQLSDLEVQYEGFLRWCDDVRTVSENEPNAVSLQIEQCQSKIAAMESHESEISALKVACEALDSNFAQETQPVMEQVQIFITKWEALKIRLVEWNVTLKERLGQVSPSPMVVETVQTAPPESLVKAMEASRKWLESLETALATEHVVSSLPQMQDMLLKFQDLSQKVEMEQGNMKHINDACSALIKEGQIGISEDFTKLNKQWETTTEALQSRIKAIEKVIEKQKQYNDEVSGLCSWMSEVDVFLQAEEPALGDIETLEAQLEQSNALQDDIVTLENNVANITTSGKQLMDEAEPELKGAISVQLDELTKRWALVTELAKAQNKSLKDALAKSQKVHEDIQALNTWLDEMDQKVPSFGPVETSSELSAAIDLFSKLREEISEHSEEFRGVNNTGNEMLQHDAAATHEELARQFTQLNGRWTDVVTQVDSRHRVLSTASEQYDDFKKLCGEETEWLNQLQEKLEKSSKSAADAEEISEALDDLEIFLHSHNESRLEQIRNLAEALVQENCMSVAVQNATHTLTSRFDTLNAQASEHQSGLEGRVQEAQAWEREYVSVLDYLVQSDMVLTQAITDSQLRIDPVQVQAELVKQQEVLKKMQTQVDVYRTQGKTEAALRLEDQVTHLLKKYEEVEMKLRLCQKPSDFDDRLQQMNQELKDISQRVHLVTVTSGDPEGIQEQLNQCMALYQRLSEVKAEVESVIATGRKIVKEGQALDPETLTLQLDQLKGLYNQLGGTVTEHRGVLERALRHSRKIHKDSSHLEEWLSTTECELDQREATIPTRNVEGEVHFAQHAIDDLGRKRPLLTGLHESYAALASMCDDDALLQPIKEQVDDIALTWERVNTRLANRLKNMQSEQVNKEAEMEKFIVGLGEIKGWLQSTEYQLTNLSAMDADEQARIIKSISTEVQNYKGHIENIRDTAVDLINHGALFQARVQPELIEINQRWENIFKNVQQCSQDIQGTSLTSVTLTAETQGSRPSPSQTDTTTTTNFSTITTSDVHETSVTTSLTSTTTQLIHTMGTTQVSDELMVHVHQQDDASTPVQSSWAGDNTSKNEEQEKGASLRSIGLVKSVMSTGTTLTSPVIGDSETMDGVTESAIVHSVEGKPVGAILDTCREFDENDVPIPVLKTVDVSDSVEMFSSADSARWGESSLVDSVIKVEPKENQTVDEDHTLTLVTNTVTKKVDRSSSEMEGIDTETVKYVLDEQPSDDTEQKKMSLVEVEEVKMTISHLSFNIAGTPSEKKVDKLEAGILACGSSEESPIDSSLEISPTAEYPPNSLLSSDLSSRDSPGKDRKRKITENDDDLDNFDELIAGLKEVAEKDITLSVIEKNRRRSAEKELDQDLSGDERFSLLKIRRRDDDDLESLASVDTDMAPASETSRDFEGTFSDLESVTESVSSKGENLFAPLGAHGLTILDTSRSEEVSTVEFISQQTQVVTSEAVTHAYISSSQQLVSPESKESLSDIISAKISSISSGVTSDNKQSVTEKEVSEKDVDGEEESHAQKDYEQLPVEKLQAMIAELEEVMSDAELSDTEDEEDPQRRNELPAEKMDVSENIQRSKTEQLLSKDVDMKDDVATEAMEEILAPDIVKTNNELSSAEKDDPIKDLSVGKEPFLAKDKAKCEADPIEFRVQEVHVGDVEFAQAKGLFEKDPGSLETPASVVKITTPLHDDVSNETSSMTSTNEITKMVIDKDKSVQKVSVQSSQVVHGITYVSSTEDRLPEAEEAVLVTLISRPSSAEVMITDTEYTEGKALMELVEEESSEADVVVPDTEKSQEGTSGIQGTVESLSATSSSSSDEDDSNKKERRPTVIECPSFSVALQEGDAENDKKVKYEDIEDTVSIHSQNEEDEISSVEAEHQLMETDTSNSEKIEACRADVEPVISVRETGDRSEFEKDIVIKKRKRFGKLYEEVDNDIKEMTSEAKLTKSTGSASSTSYVPYKEEKVTPEELEKVMRKRGLLTKKALYENWESISSCSSGNESKRGSSTEGSIDFGSETRGAVSGDWDDAPILTDLNLQNPSAESKSVPVESIPEEAATDPRKEELRFSFVSSSSIEIDRDEVFTSEVEMDFQDVDALAEVAEIDSPSSDESDDLEEPSKVRISAATIYEDAVIQALEGGNERGTKKRKKINVNPQIDKVEAVKNEPQTSGDNRASVCSFSEQLSEEIIEPKSDVTESTARFEEKEKESTEKAHQPEESSKSLLTMHESPKIRDGEALLASEGKHEGEESVHKKQPNEGEVLEIIYEVVTVTRTKEPKAQTVIERVIIEPEETVSETESDTEETLKTRTEPKGYLPADEKHSKSGNEYLRSTIDALSLSANTTSKDSDAETDRDVIDADVKAKIDLSPSSSQALRGEPKCRDSQDGEKQMVCVVQTTTNITHTLPSINEDVPNNSKPACEVSHEILQGEGDKIDVDVTISELASENSLNKVIPQYTSSVRDEKETYEIAIESQMNSSIAVSLVSVEVEEVFNKADVSETSTDESKQYRIKEDHEGSPECSMKSGTVMDEASKVLLVVSKHEQYVQKDPETMEDFPGIEETVDKAVSHSFMDTHKTENIPEGVHAHYKQGTDDKSLASVITGRNEEVFVNPVVDDISDNLTTETFEDEVKNSSHRPSGSDSEDSLKEFGKEDDIQTGQLTRRLSTSSSSSSNSSFEMVECEPEVDLEEQLSSHESYEEAEIEDKEELVESDESLDKMTECTTIGEAVHPEIASISLEIKLERHVSIDSSVSTLSEAETVIHVPIGSLPKKISETASVKDDSQIGVKSGEAKDPLVRSVSEELITKTGNQGGIKQIGKSPTVPEAVESGKEDVKKDEEKEEVAASYVEVKPIQQKEFRDDTGYQKAEVVTTGIKVDDDMKGCPVEIISSVPIRHEYYPVESCTISTLPVNVSKHDKEGKKYSDSVVLMNPGFLMVEPSCIVEEENTENADMDKSAYVNIIKDKKKEDPGYTFLSKAEEKSPLNVSRTDDSVKEVPLVHEEGWTEIKILNVEEKDQVNLERRVSVDVAQVVQTTEVSEEQEVTISIPDIHSEDLRDDSSVQSDEEQASKVCKLKEENPVDYIPKQISEGEHFIVLQHHVESRKLPADSPAKTEVPLDVSNYHGVEAKADDNIVDIIGEEETSISLDHGRITSSISDDAEKVGLGITHKNDGKEVHSYSHYELKDIGFVVIEEHSDPKYANLENKEHKDLKEKESSSSCNTSNSNSSSPYYDASGEMVESLGSDEVSSSMEVLHSSAEILDSSQANWSSMTDQSMPSLDGQSHDEGSDKSVPLREIRKGPLTWSGQRDSRFSTISCCTDASEGELIFSETEGEELPYEDTTDDDLTLEEEAIKVLAEKHEAGGTPKPAAVSFTKDTSRQQTQTSSSTVTSVSKISHVYTTQSAVKGGKETHKAGDDEVDAYLREVTLLADKITELKKKAGTVPSYQEAKDKSEALEQEVALLEPDVATVISRGDTLTLTTHMVDVPRANTIRTAVHDLRTHWSSLKGETETVKLETGEVITKINNIQSKSDDIVGWMNDVSKRLHLVNNDESQLEALEKEMADKKSELDNLNESGKLLKKYGYEQIQPLLAIINTRWIELTTQFSQYRKVSLEKKTIVSSNAQQEVEPVVVPDFIASVNRLREAISAISRQLNANKLAGRRYDNLKLQEEELKTIKQGLETLKPRVDNLETERNNTIKNVTQTQSEQIRRVMDKLREEWAQVNRGYTERHALWLQCSETWRTLQKTIDDFSVWLSTIEERVQITANQPLPEAKITQKELEKQVTLKHRPSQTLQSTCKEVTEDMSLDDAKRLQERVDTLMKRWRALLLDLAARRERIAGEEGGKDSTSSEYEALLVWVDQAQALMDAPVNVTDEATLSAHSTMIQNHLVEMTTKQNLLKKLKDSKPKAVTPAQLSTLETNLNKVAKTLPEYKNLIETKLGVTKTLVTDVEDLYKWTEEMRVKVALRNMTDEEIKLSKITLREKETLYENLDSTYWVLAQDTESKGLTVSVALKNRMNTIESRLKALQGQLYESSASATPPSPTSPTFSRITPEKADQEKVVGEKDAKAASKEGEVLKKAAAVAVAASKTTPEVVTTTSTKTTTTKGKVEKTEALSVTSGTTVTSSVTSVIQNVIKFEESVFGAEGALRPPSPLVCPPKHAPDSSPVLILASLDKSILQIRDWLTLMEQMTRQQTVVVGDADDIRQLTEKQKNVLRELEGKKPQLDELVASADSLKDDASRTQLHQKVSKLREHWDETNSVVLARKTQLDAMYADTHKFDAKRAELETWLARMEARLERMAPVAHTADVLDQQIREQKGFHAEIHQYKHQVELFNQMTQRLIAIYQHDDTRRLKKITETINLRYSSLNSSIIARGKALHSAMNSLHNFDKALDKFASWMSEAESSTDILELEVDKLGPGRRDLQARAPIAHLKDLQSEIESHKDVLASLNATGQKLLGTLENQDEAVMLQRRLEEMNQRWNTLKHKSIAIRNRLEGNAENWNSLLLSLRELIEWVIRKDTELTALGPLVGDLNALAKFSDDLAAFRRVIDEKQPVIESNLKSGRQLIASEPPLSDTSDSEAGRELDGDARYRGDDNARDLTRAVRREVAKLSEKWAALRERAAAANAQADLACKKLGVLQKTVEEVSGRLEEAQKTVDTWGAVPQDPNLADQHVHNVRKFREGLAELQRGVDDVNDQAARFSAHNVPLTPANSAKLHDLNNRWKTLETTVNDRWRQVAGRSREVTPLTPAQLASSVSPPWERATTSNKVPYYINHDQESTHWDHPTMMDLLDSLTEFNHIKFSAYRTATKLRMLQKTLALDRAKMQMATDVFDEHGLRGQNDRLIDVGDMVVVLSALYANISADHPEVNTTLAMDLCLNWLLNVYDSQRTGQMRVLSFKIGIVCLCRGHLEEKYRYMFRLIADPNRLVDQRKLGLLLHDCVQVPRQLGEVAAFGGSNIEPSVRSCFTKAGKDRETIEAVHFLTWVQQEPQSLVWLAVLHRVAASENIQHQVKCNICKAYPIVGLRYRCLKCLSFDMCQRCFFDGRSGKSHKITHPMHEYCTATTAGEDVKDFTKALKNKFKSKRALQKHTKKGYLPVQTVLEGDPLESPSPSPQHNVTSQDMHSRLELYASRLAEVELRTNSNSTPDRSLVSSLSEDEHGLIAQYCQSLSSSDAPLPVPRSPLQIMAAVDAEQKDELEQMIRALEEENSQLQAEYDRLKSQQPVGSPPDDGLSGQRSEADMLAEAKLLRQHKGRLEARMGILEEHNRQLEAQLHRLRQLLGEPGGMSSPNKSGTLQTKSVTASQLAMDSPAKVNGHSNQGGASSAYEGLDQMSEYVRPPPPPMGSVAHVGNLFSRAGDLGKAVGTLVATMTHEGASDLPSDEEERSEASDTEEEKAV